MRSSTRRTALWAGCAGALAVLSACGGTSVPATYTVGGTVTGLSGSGLVLQNNSAGDLPVAAAGAFTFVTALASGSAYTVTVKTQPSAPAQNCVVTNGAGKMGMANVTNVAVTCSTLAMHTVGGVVTGLTGAGLVLDYYDTVNPVVHLPVAANGAFAFPAGFVEGSLYQVVVGVEPSSPTQNCVVTGGTGAIGGADISDIAVACSGVGRFAYVANAGDNTILAYTIDAATGVLTPLGAPVPTGASPYSIVASPDGQHVYVVNEGTNNVSVYAVDATSGVLTEIPGSPFGAGTDPQALAFDPAGAHLYVANNGSNNLSAYSVDAVTGGLTPLATATFPAGKGPSAISVDDAGKFLFVANNGGSNSISVFAIAAGAGTLTPVAGSPFAAGSPGDSPLSIAFVDSWALYGLYVTTFNTSTGSHVVTFKVDRATGALTVLAGYVVSVDNYIATDRNGLFLYGATAGGLAGYGVLDGGALLSLSGYPYATGANAYSVTVDPSNQFVFVPNDGAGTVSGFVRHAGGGLSPIPGSPFPAGKNPDFIAIPDLSAGSGQPFQHVH